MSEERPHGFGQPAWVEARDYQQEAVDAWVDAGGQGILNMATGTGKTITSLLAASELAHRQNGRLALIIAVPYQHLVDQWVDDLEDFGASPIRAYRSRNRWLDDAVSQATEFAMGARDVLVVVPTHHTLASDHFQSVIDRLNGAETMVIVDEVHHAGAPHLRTGLPDQVRARLGLSATPERWYDDEGTETLMDYFSSGIVYEYGLQEAIRNGHLCEYYYVPHIIDLTPDEEERYLAISKAIGRLMADIGGDGDGGDIGDAELQNESLKRLLIKRSRLIGAAENKLQRLRNLLETSDDIHHTLVYCGDGRVPADRDEESADSTATSIDGSVEIETERQIEAATQILGHDLGIKAHQFTYEESQAEREQLLADFESGALQALVAIRCLDEGVDVPATETAFILASSSNPRQFVQRRGRILRQHPGKDHAVIHDFIVAPPPVVRRDGTEDTMFNIERNLVRKELQRVSTFADAARNHPDSAPAGVPTTSGSITDLKRDFNLLDS